MVVAGVSSSELSSSELDSSLTFFAETGARNKKQKLNCYDMEYFDYKPFAGVLTTVSSSELSSSELDSWVFFTAGRATGFLTTGVLSSSSELSSSELDPSFPFLAATTENNQNDQYLASHLIIIIRYNKCLIMLVKS